MRRPLGIAVILGVALLSPRTAWAGDPAAPYQDPSAAGGIGLCDRAGNVITHGSIDDEPFVWRAVSTAPATGGYAAAGRTATLYAYQPREGVPPGDWSGDQLTATTRYSNPAHPMAQATGGDESLADFIAEFRPSWQGLLQLRIFLGAPGQQVASFNYPATSIRVTGRNWQVVNPVSVSCNSGSARSIESILLPKSSTSGGTGQESTASAVRSGPAPSTNSSSGSKIRPLRPSDATNASDATSHRHSAWIGSGLVAGFLVVVAAGYLARRRRSAVPNSQRAAAKEDK